MCLNSPASHHFPARRADDSVTTLSVSLCISVSGAGMKKVKGELCLNPVVVPLTVSLGMRQLSSNPTASLTPTLTVFKVFVSVCK